MELDLGERREALPPNGFARAHRITPTSWENGEEAVDEEAPAALSLSPS